MKLSSNLNKRSELCRALMALTAAILLFAGMAPAQSDAVLSAAANPHGITLTDMAEKLALFDTGGNNPKYYPDTPFRILFQDLAKQVVVPAS